MSDNAQAWVWQHSRTKGAARLVLLALAYACTSDTVRMGTAELMRLTRTGKGGVIAAVAAAVELGELVIVAPGSGSRAALYRLPGVTASGPVSGPLNARSGPVSGPQTPTENRLRSGERTANDLRSGERTAKPTASGPVSGPLQPELTFDTDHATRARPSSKAFTNMLEGENERPAPAAIESGIPDFARPLVDTLTASGVVVRWDLSGIEWFTIDALMKRSGADMLAAAAVRAAARTDVSHARYFLRAWRNLPPAPAAGTTPVATGADVIPLAAARASRSVTGHQPFQCPPAAAYQNDLGF